VTIKVPIDVYEELERDLSAKRSADQVLKFVAGQLAHRVTILRFGRRNK